MFVYIYTPLFYNSTTKTKYSQENIRNKIMEKNSNNSNNWYKWRKAGRGFLPGLGSTPPMYKYVLLINYSDQFSGGTGWFDYEEGGPAPVPES